MIRFFASKGELRFYTIRDKDIIQSVFNERIKNKSFSIFYPIGFKSVNMKEILTTKKLTQIMEVAKEDPKVAEYHSKIVLRIRELKHELTMETIIKSYTAQGLYNIFNLYVRYGHIEGFNLFSEYIFCLKGALIEIGIPVSTTNINCVYMGMSLPQEDLRKWTEACNSPNQIDKFGLLPAFTSTTTDVSVADYIINLEKGKLENQQDMKFVKLIMKLENENEEYCEFLKKFGLIKGSGVLYPADISKFSIYSDEKEILFPQFYPFKFDHIEESNGIICIHLNVPNKLCFSATKDSVTTLNMCEATDIWNKEYIDKTLDLVKQNLHTGIIFCIQPFYYSFR